MKISWKIIFIIIGCILAIGYIIFANVSFSGKSSSEVCRAVQITVKDSSQIGFVTARQIAQTLAGHHFSLMGDEMKNINLAKIENELHKNQYIEKTECYKTLDGTLKINIWQRKPVVHVMMGTENYYLDAEGHKLPFALGYSVYVPVVSGEFSPAYMQNKLFPFIRHISKDEFWNAQIEQINVRADSLVELVPRVGDYIINLGTIDRFEAKLNKLMTLYINAFNKIGWNRYSYIDLQYRNRVICTKRDSTATKPVVEQEGTEPIQ
jgi:cell division protein FtsQ